MDCGTVSKNMDFAFQQAEKETVYFLDDTILEAVKFLNYEKWSKMRFLCHRFNQFIQTNQSKLQAFEVKCLIMVNIWCSGNSIVSFDQGIQSANAMRKWFQDRGYSCDETTDIPLEKVFAGMDLCLHNTLQFTIRAFFEEPIEKNMSLTRGPIENRCLPNAVAVRLNLRQLFSAKFNPEYGFCAPILSHFFRLLYHPAAYFREVSMLSPLTDKFCDKPLKNLIRCDQFTLHHLDSVTFVIMSYFIMDNVHAQNITLAFNFNKKNSDSEFYSLVSEFLDSSICAKDCITLDWLHYPSKFVCTFIEKYETMELTKAIPSILINAIPSSEDCPSNVQEYLKSNLVSRDDLPLYDKRCDKCNVKTYQLQNKLDGTRKMIVHFRHGDELCFKPDCSYYGTTIFRMRFE